MNIFIIEKSYVIKKIKSVADGWKLYPQDKKKFLSASNTMPVKFLLSFHGKLLSWILFLFGVLMRKSAL